MLKPRYLPFVVRQVVRQRVRSVLTVLGVAVAMYLFCMVQAVQDGVREATEVAAGDTTLVVYRENRYCPFTSRLPQHYASRIGAIDGVEQVVPMRIMVSNCRASLDVVTFRGVPADAFRAKVESELTLTEGSMEAWERRSDAALIGSALAARRGVRVGDQFTAAGISVHVAGVVASDEPQDRNVAYTHLGFIQETARRGGTGGIVTQFNVRVSDPNALEAIAGRIDAEFAHDQEPTATYPEKAFVARAASDVLELTRFASWLGIGALAAVFALVANAIILAVQDRVRDHAVLQTLGYRRGLIARLIVAEGVTVGAIGGLLGAAAAGITLFVGRFNLTMEGLSIEVVPAPEVVATGFVISVVLAGGAGLIPAWQAARGEIASGFRAV